MAHDVPSRTVPVRDDRPLVGAGALAIAIAGLVLLAGVPGLIAGIAVAAAWTRAPSEYTIVVGHVFIGALVSSASNVYYLGLAEIGLFGILLASALPPDHPLAGTAGFLGATVGLGATAWWLHGDSYPVWLVLLVILGTIAFAIYVLHRYELVKLDLVAREGSV